MGGGVVVRAEDGSVLYDAALACPAESQEREAA